MKYGDFRRLLVVIVVLGGYRGSERAVVKNGIDIKIDI